MNLAASRDVIDLCLYLSWGSPSVFFPLLFNFLTSVRNRFSGIAEKEISMLPKMDRNGLNLITNNVCLVEKSRNSANITAFAAFAYESISPQIKSRI